MVAFVKYLGGVYVTAFSVQSVWKPHCWGDDWSLTSKSSSWKRTTVNSMSTTSWKTVCCYDNAKIAFLFSLLCWPGTQSWSSSVQIQIWFTKSCVPLQRGLCEAEACEISLWCCLGRGDYNGFRLWSPVLFVCTWSDGESMWQPIDSDMFFQNTSADKRVHNLKSEQYCCTHVKFLNVKKE